MNALEDVIKNSPVIVDPGRYAIVQAKAPITPGAYFLVVQDDQETTVITDESRLRTLAVIAEEKWFKLIEIRVNAPFGAPGFLARISQGIAAAGINIFIVSTFSKDYLLLREEDILAGLRVLMSLGFKIETL